ncbi:MAG TPA: hypothetical protein DHV26_11780 [Cytophagales bacterium]|nr:hypothetical protein [Cytophagales bacterium]
MIATILFYAKLKISMKNIIHITQLILVINLLILAGCKKDDPQPETERIQNLLASGTWQIENVLVNETDQTASFAGLTLSFTKTTYSTTNGGIVWPANGSWEFVDATADKIIRDDDLEITLAEVTSTSLKLSFINPTTTIGAGRVASTAGEHEFHFAKN